MSEEAITLKVGKSQESVERAKVVWVSVRDTSHQKRNMLIGTAVGAGLGLAIAVPVGMLCSNEGNCGTGQTAGAALAVVGLGAAGAGLGAIPGSRTVYRGRSDGLESRTIDRRRWSPTLVAGTGSSSF
jgi:hypothetical protein